MFRWQADDVIPLIDVPVLVLVGTSDIVTLPGASDVIASLASRSRLSRVADVGHMGFLEQFEVYNGEIAAFATEAFAVARQAGDRVNPELVETERSEAVIRL
jgi:pimeloyl-ACP methyl ester carboxylesterase